MGGDEAPGHPSDLWKLSSEGRREEFLRVVKRPPLLLSHSFGFFSCHSFPALNSLIKSSKVELSFNFAFILHLYPGEGI